MCEEYGIFRYHKASLYGNYIWRYNLAFNLLRDNSTTTILAGIRKAWELHVKRVRAAFLSWGVFIKRSCEGPWPGISTSTTVATCEDRILRCDDILYMIYDKCKFEGRLRFLNMFSLWVSVNSHCARQFLIPKQLEWLLTYNTFVRLLRNIFTLGFALLSFERLSGEAPSIWSLRWRRGWLCTTDPGLS